MNEPARLPSPDPPRRVGHETRDVSPFYVGLFALGLALMIGLVLPLVSWIFWRFEAGAERTDPPQSPLAGDQVPPPPRLQTQPAADLARLRQQEDQILSSYGWIHRKQRIVRVPVTRAIELLSERGLPEPEAPPQPPKEKGQTP